MMSLCLTERIIDPILHSLCACTEMGQLFPTSSEPVLPGINSGLVYLRTLWLKPATCCSCRIHATTLDRPSNGKHLAGKKTLILIAPLFYVPCPMCLV